MLPWIAVPTIGSRRHRYSYFYHYGWDSSSLCVRALISSDKRQITLLRALLTIRDDPVSVVGIVVVDIACGIHITHIVRITGVRGTSLTTANPYLYTVQYQPFANYGALSVPQQRVSSNTPYGSFPR